LNKFNVYHIPGREVATLIRENMNRGEHSDHFRHSELASGRFFINLETPTFQETNTIELVK